MNSVLYIELISMRHRRYFYSMLSQGIRVNLTYIKFITLIRTITFRQSVKSKSFYSGDKLYEGQPSDIKITMIIIPSYSTSTDSATY